jgi:colicin import membrane protein
MPKIKVYAASLGFYETAVAARSQKMALAHWGMTHDLFREGTAKETHDPKAVEAAMRKVGLVVRRPIGSTGLFEERAEAVRSLLKKLG